MALNYTHTRDAWVPGGLPVSGPTFDWSKIDRFVFHYTAADNLIDGDPGEKSDNLAGYLRAINREYWNRKTANVPNGYAIGYNAAVDWLGGTWELRGDTFKCAANGCLDENEKNWNIRTFALLCLVDGADPLTDVAVAAAQDLIAQVRAHAPLAVTAVGHRNVCATACPGAGIYRQIEAGLFLPIAPPPPPDPEPDPEPAPEPDPDPAPAPIPDVEDDDVTKLFIAKYKNGGTDEAPTFTGIIGDGLTSFLIPVAHEFDQVEDAIDAGGRDYFNPVTGVKVASRVEIPVIGSKRAVAVVGKPR